MKMTKNAARKGLCLLLAGALSTSVLLTGCVSKEEQEQKEQEIASLQQTVDLLKSYIEVNMKADLENWDGSYVGNGSTNIHKLYDDTAVLEAYQSGDSSALNEEDKYILETAQSIIKELGITDSMSEYEKEKAVYDWQVMYTAYDSSQQTAIPNNISDYNYWPYGVLKYHSAICVGNATTFKLFMDLLGIDCKIIHSVAEGEHAWNLVKIDGDWYHVDVTFDGRACNKPVYAYFNVPDSVKQNSGYPWNAEDFPAATATKYSMAVQDCHTLKDLYELPEAIFDAYRAGENHVFVKTEDFSAVDYQIIDQISCAFGWVLQSNEYAYCYLSQTYNLEDGSVIYNISIEQGTNEPVTPEESAYDYDKMQEIICEVFGVDN